MDQLSEAPVGVQIVDRELRGTKPNFAKRMARMLPFLPPHLQLEIDQNDRKHRKAKCGRRGVKNRRIISSKVIDGVRHEFHATKGPRRYRA